MPKLLRIFDPRYFVIFLIVLATVGVAVAGYVAQAIQYDHLFGLYEQQNAQLRANGIKPLTPSPNQVAAQGAAGTDGAVGARGAQGIPGVDGLLGSSGAAGLTGPAGATGATGNAGTPGTNGINGTNGADGATGPAGPAGAIPQSLTFITPSGTIYICTPTTTTIPTYACTVQVTPAPVGAVVTPAFR